MIVKSNPAARIFALVVSTIVSLILFEIILRVAFPEYERKYFIAPTDNQYDFYRFNETLGWDNVPFMKGVQRRYEFEYPVLINGYGMRDKSVNIEPRKGISRIAFLGDSFVWGIGVPDEERFTDIIGKLPTVESLNFGVSGYGPVQYYLILDKVIKFKPDVVVLAFCLSNDFGDNVYYKRYGYYKPYVVLNESGGIDLKGYPLINVHKFGGKTLFSNMFLKHSRFLMMVSYGIDKIRERIDNSGLTGFDDMDIYDYPGLSANQRKKADRAVLINKLILGKIKQELDAVHIPFVIVAAPTKYEYSRSDPNSGDPINTNALNILERTARELDIDLIDPTPYLNIHDFWLLDGHYNSRGHKKIAELIERYLYFQALVMRKLNNEDFMNRVE